MKFIKSTINRLLTVLFAVLILTVALTTAARAQTTVFTYQGRLSDASAAANGIYDLQFTLYHAAGVAVGSLVAREDVTVTNGIFTVSLDFGATAFDGSTRTLEIAVRRGNETGAFTTLTPRQPITSTPYVIQSLNAANASNLGGTAASNYLQTTGSGANLTNLNASSITTGTLGDANLSANVAFRNQSNTFSGNQFFTGNISQTGTTADLNLTNGFVTRGTFNTGAIPITGAGVRLMFYPGKAAVRGGRVDADQWDDANIGSLSTAFGNNTMATNRAAFAAGEGTLASGTNSTALGYFTTASGFASTAFGERTTANGNYSTALGRSTTASGLNSTALGYLTTASGAYSTALGLNTTASGNYSTALGYFTTASGTYSTALGGEASTNGKAGSFVYGDNSTFSIINATTANQFVVRAQNIWLGQNNSVTNTANRFIETSTGAYLSTSGVWTDNSSRSLKTNFSIIDSRDVLRKVLGLQIQTWNYKADTPNIRHIGVMAQDFYKAFEVGADDEHLTAVDTAGVAMAAIQGLNEELNEQTAKLKAENNALKDKLDKQQTTIDALKKLVCAGNPTAAVCRQP